MWKIALDFLFLFCGVMAFVAGTMIALLLLQFLIAVYQVYFGDCDNENEF